MRDNFRETQKYGRSNSLKLDYLNIEKENEKDFLNDVLEGIEDIKMDLEKRLEIINKSEDELYYVYSYTPNKIYVTKRGSNKLEILENISEELKNNLAEGFILRSKNGTFIIDEELTEKSMNFELNFDDLKNDN